MNTKQTSERVAKDFMASLAEKEVEKLFKVLLPKSPFRNKAFAVGGYVRDELLGIDSKDLDVVVEMKGGAEKITHWIHSKFPSATSRPHQLGAGYPIWAITFKEHVTHGGKVYRTKGGEIEFADSQKEIYPDPNSRRRETRPGTLQEDNERRDFTVNMLLKDLSSGEIKDLSGQSLNDIKKGVLRGYPGVDLNRTFKEDELRMMRLVRFQAKYGWRVPLDVIKIVKSNAAGIKNVSGERIRDELVKLMEIGKLKQGIRFMNTLGLLKYVLPEIEEMQGVMHDTTRGHHQEGSVYKHTLLVLQSAKPGVVNQLAALLHDVGKPKTQEILIDKITFLGHDKVGAEMAEAVMRRLKFEGKVIRKVKHMVENHMRPHGLVFGDEPTSKKALRKFVRKVGEEMVDSILDLAEADQLGNLPPKNLIPALRERIEEAMEIPMTSKPILNGGEIMRLLRLKPGPEIGEAMAFLKDQQDEYAGNGKVLSKNDAMGLLLDWRREQRE